MEDFIVIRQKNLGERATHRGKESEKQKTKHEDEWQTPPRPCAAKPPPRETPAAARRDAARQARSLLSNQLHLEGQEQIAVCPRRRCRRGQPPVGELSSTARTGRRMGDFGHRVVAASNASASSLGEEKNGAKTIDSQEK